MSENVILFVELKGFTNISTELSRDMDEISINPERVRASTTHFVDYAIKEINELIKSTEYFKIGADTWYATFDSVEKSIKFSCLLLKRFRDMIEKKGLFFIKPSLAINLANPKFQDGRFMDDESIMAYRVADHGKPLTCGIIGDAVSIAKGIGWVQLNEEKSSGEPEKKYFLDWQNIDVGIDLPSEYTLKLPTLLMDNEVLYANSSEEAIQNIVEHQKQAKSITVFGGPISLEVGFYKKYLVDTIAQIKNNDTIWTVLSYLPKNEPDTCYIWLELCRRLMIAFPTKFSFSAFVIENDQLRPFSYQIFDKKIIHVGLRSYSPIKGTSTMSSAIILKNPRIVSRFHEEFIESWRKLETLDDKAFGDLSEQLNPSDTAKQNALTIVNDLLQ